VVDGGHGRLGDAAHGDDDGVGVFALVGLDQLVLATELLAPFVEDFLDDRLGVLEGLVLGFAGFGVNVRHTNGSHGHGIGRVELNLGHVGRQKLLDFRLGRHLERLDHVAQGEAVQVDLHRQKDPLVLGNPESDGHEVHHFLAEFTDELNPPGVSGVHEIGMVVPDVDGGAQSPVGHGHDDGQTEGCRDVAKFRHQGVSLGAGGGEGAGAGGGRTDAATHGAVLGFHGDEFRVQMTISHHLGEVLHDVSLGRDGVRGYHIHITEPCRFGSCNGDFHSNVFRHINRPPVPW